MSNQIPDSEIQISPFQDIAKLIHDELPRIQEEAAHQAAIHQTAYVEEYFIVHEIAGLLEGALKTRARLGNEIFRFNSFVQWVNKASSWFRGAKLRDGLGYVCIDAKGRICQYGKHFIRARDENTFPIVVHEVE